MLTSRLQPHTDHKNPIYSMRMHQNLPFFMGKTAKNGRFLASAKQLKSSPPLF